MDNKALGKGLSALIPRKDILDGKDKVSYIKTNLIKNNNLQPRSNYDDKKLEELKASIKEKGILQPILIREKEEGFEVVAGERRLRAARALSLEDVPAIIKQVTDQEALVIALVENIQREGLNPIEEAESFKKLVKDFGYSKEEIAQSVGKDRSTISNLLRLLKLPEKIKKGLSLGDITSGHARALLSLDDIGEQLKAFEEIVKKQLSVRDVEVLVKKGFKSTVVKLSKLKQKDHEIISLEEKLQKILGTKVSIIADKKKGKISIEYYSLDDLDRIIAIINKG